MSKEAVNSDVESLNDSTERQYAPEKILDVKNEAADVKPDLQLKKVPEYVTCMASEPVDEGTLIAAFEAIKSKKNKENENAS